MKSSIIQFKFLKTALLGSLLLGFVFSSCKKDSTPPIPPADKIALAAAIATAQGFSDNSVEGTKPGQYEVGSKAALNAALAASKLINADTKASQTSVNNTVAQLLAAIAAYQAKFIKEIAEANLIGFWKLNGNANDSSGKGNNGTAKAGHPFYGAGSLVSSADRFGRANMAYTFDKGSNIEVPYTANLNPQQMTISLWCNKTTAGRTVNADTYTFLSLNRWNAYKFQLQSGNLTFFTVKAVKAVGDTAYHDRDDAGVALTNGTWYHVVVTYKPGQMDFYINGDLVKSWTNTPGTALSIAANPVNFVIGQDLPTSKYLTVDGDFQVAWGGFFTGAMDDVMFYNIALDGPQIKSIYNNQKTL